MSALASVAVFLALMVQAQTQAQAQAPTFRATTRLVELSVTALDRRGQAVTDLKLEDFTIEEGGKVRPITIFKYEGGKSTEPNALPLPTGLFTNRVEFTPGPPRNITALLLDELNTPIQNSMRVRAMAMKYLKALAPQSRMAVFQMSSGLRVLHDFTDDADSLRGRIDKALIAMPLEATIDMDKAVIEAEQFVDMFADDRQLAAEAVEIARSQLETDMLANAQARAIRLQKTLASIESLGQHLSGIPGRKNLVWIGGGISISSVTGALGTGPHGSIETFEDKVKRTSQKLAQQGVILYVVDAKGLEVARSQSAESAGSLPVRGRGRFESQQDAEVLSNDTFPAMEMMSSMTGGRYLRNSNDLAAGFKSAMADLAGSYTLGFYVSDEPDNKWHPLKASVKRSGVELRHRKGYLAEPIATAPAVWTNEMAMAAVSDPVGSSAVQLTAYVGPSPDGEAGTLVANLQIEPASLRFQAEGANLQARIQVLFAERGPAGGTRLMSDAPAIKIPAQNWDAAQQEGLRYSRQWKPAPDAVSVRIIVRDMATGKYGTLDVPLKKIPAVRK
jgi:VWFA-related protein